MGLGLLFDRFGFREKMDKVVEGLAFPPVELPRMDLVLSRNLRDRLLFLKHLQHHLSFERRGMMFLFWHDVSSVTLEALKTCLVFGDHYRKGRIQIRSSTLYYTSDEPRFAS